MTQAKKLKKLLETEKSIALDNDLHSICADTISKIDRKLRAIDFRSIGNSDFINVHYQELSINLTAPLSEKEVLSTLVVPYVKSFNHFFSSYELFSQTESDRVEVRIYSDTPRLKKLLSEIEMLTLEWNSLLFSVQFYYYSLEGGTKAEIYVRVTSEFLLEIFNRLVDRQYRGKDPISFLNSCAEELLKCTDVLVKALRLTEFAEKI